MEQMDTAAVAVWFADALKLPQYAAAVKEHEVDGFVLLDLAQRDNLADLGIKGNMHQSKVRGAIATLEGSLQRQHKRAAKDIPGGTDVARVKRPRLAGAEAEATPAPAAASSSAAVVGGGEQAGFQQAAAQLELAAPAPAAEAAAVATPVFVAQSAAHGRHFYVSKPSENLMCPLCLEAVAEQPAALRCGHIFCRGCLLTALVADRRCPTCRAAASDACRDVSDALETLVTPAHAIASLIDELPVRCPCGVVQAAGGGEDDWVVTLDGCEVIVARGQLAAHTACCAFEPVGCAQAGHGCGWRGPRRGLAEHAASCWYERGRQHLERAAERSNTCLVLAESAAAAAEEAAATAASAVRRWTWPRVVLERILIHLADYDSCHSGQMMTRVTHSQLQVAREGALAAGLQRLQAELLEAGARTQAGLQSLRAVVQHGPGPPRAFSGP
jgi:hypothetical protein